MVTHLMCFCHTGILRHHQVKVNETLATSFSGTDFMKTDQLPTVLLNTGNYFMLFCRGNLTSTNSPNDFLIMS